MTAQEIALWCFNHWYLIIVGLYAADIIVKLTPTKYDDLTLTVIKKVLGKLVGRNLSNPEKWLNENSKESEEKKNETDN